MLFVFCAVFLVAFKGWLYNQMRNHTVHIQKRLLLLNVLFHTLVEYGHLKLLVDECFPTFLTGERSVDLFLFSIFWQRRE